MHAGQHRKTPRGDVLDDDARRMLWKKESPVLTLYILWAPWSLARSCLPYAGGGGVGVAILGNCCVKVVEWHEVVRVNTSRAFAQVDGLSLAGKGGCASADVIYVGRDIE